MTDPPEPPLLASPPEVTLDGAAIVLPAAAFFFLGAIRAHLEAVALKRQRVLCALSVDGVPLNLSRGLPRVARFQRVTGETLGFEQLSRQLAWATHEQIVLLRTRVEATALRMVINEGAQAQRLWWELMPDLKAPLLTLIFLPEICGDQASKILVEPLAGIIVDLNHVLDEINAACYHGDVLELSATLELQLLPWLDRLLKTVGKIYETVAP